MFPARARRRRKEPATVTFSPLAWLKLLMFLHAGDTEVGGFGISSEKQPLYIEDFVTVKQTVTAMTVAFDDTAVADYFDDCIDKGLTPGRFARIWIHTHPGESAQPSSVDEETFDRVFGDCDWAVMLIVSRTQATYARVSFGAGPGGSVMVPVTVDWAAWPQVLLERSAELSAMSEKWMDEFGQNIHPAPQERGLKLPVERKSTESFKGDDRQRADDLYLLHDQMGLEDDFASYYEAYGDHFGIYETIGLEER
jgi:proteasome lid subunit RPN8/RPN11